MIGSIGEFPARPDRIGWLKASIRDMKRVLDRLQKMSETRPLSVNRSART
jgi:hypothetical protein